MFDIARWACAAFALRTALARGWKHRKLLDRFGRSTFRTYQILTSGTYLLQQFKFCAALLTSVFIDWHLNRLRYLNIRETFVFQDQLYLPKRPSTSPPLYL